MGVHGRDYVKYAMLFIVHKAYAESDQLSRAGCMHLVSGYVGVAVWQVEWGAMFITEQGELCMTGRE